MIDKTDNSNRKRFANDRWPDLNVWWSLMKQIAFIGEIRNKVHFRLLNDIKIANGLY